MPNHICKETRVFCTGEGHISTGCELRACTAGLGIKTQEEEWWERELTRAGAPVIQGSIELWAWVFL